MGSTRIKIQANLASKLKARSRFNRKTKKAYPRLRYSNRKRSFRKRLWNLINSKKFMTTENVLPFNPLSKTTINKKFLLKVSILQYRFRNIESSGLGSFWKGLHGEKKIDQRYLCIEDHQNSREQYIDKLIVNQKRTLDLQKDCRLALG